MNDRRAVFLDRDGTLIVEKHYIRDPLQVKLEAGAGKALRSLAEAGLLLIVVSNQSGVARKILTLEDVHRVNERTRALLEAEGVYVHGWYMCSHAPDDGCRCRKPLPGLGHAAASDHGIDLASSFMVGDKESDLLFGKNIGAYPFLVRSGHSDSAVEWARTNNFAVCRDLPAVAAEIIKNLGR